MSRRTNKPKLVAVVGPTASGKTTLAKYIAQKYSGELINADSRQIYRGMDIGTAKDTSFPHHLVDILEPTETFSAADYKEKAEETIADIHKKRNLPILVGGTGLYIDAVVYNYQFPGREADPEIRKKLQQKPVEELHRQLEELDPQAAATAQKNKRRLIRALEVIGQTGELFSTQKKKGPQKYNALLIGRRYPRKELYARIEERVKKQIKQGLVEEVAGLIQKYGADAYALQNTIGYKELIPHITNNTSLESAPVKLRTGQAKQEIIKNTRRYARRQMVWFKRNKDIHWVKDTKEAEELVKKFLQS